MSLSTFARLFFCLASLATANIFAQEDQEAASAAAAKEWLELVDKGDYSSSWQTASPRLQLTLPKDQWDQYMKNIRGSLGEVKSREIARQQPAQDPQGLPAGAYMVILYQTSFAGKDNVPELVTLSQGYDGKWRVLTYFIKSN